MNENEYLVKEPIGKLIRQFAIPGVVAMVVNSLYNIVDQIFIGQSVGYLGNAATNIILPVAVTALALAIMLGDGGAVFMSLNLGSKRRLVASSGTKSVLTASVVLGLTLAAAVVLFIEPICRLCGATDTVLPYAVTYGRIIALGIPFVVTSVVLNAIIRADGSPKYAMASMVTGAITNVVLDALFIFGFGWGIAGAAWATIAGQAVALAINLWYLKQFRTINIGRKHGKLRWDMLGSACGLGTSSLVNQIAVVIAIIVGNTLIAKYGAQSEYGPDIPLAAYGITMKVGQIVMSIILGIAVGCQPIIGYNYGAGYKDRVRAIFLRIVKICTIITVAATVVFELFPQSIVNIFGSESELYNRFAVNSFRIYLALTVLNGFQICSAIFFQSIGKPIKSTMLSLSRQLILLIPAWYLFCRLIGVEGILWGGPVTDSIAFAIALSFILPELRRLKHA